MKFCYEVASSRRKNRKLFFDSSSDERRIIMSAPLSNILQKKYNIKSIPVRKNDEVKIVRGSMKGRAGKIIQCHRRNFSIFVEKITCSKTGKSASYIPISPSNVIITNLSITNDRKIFFLKKKTTNE